MLFGSFAKKISVITAPEPIILIVRVARKGSRLITSELIMLFGRYAKKGAGGMKKMCDIPKRNGQGGIRTRGTGITSTPV